MKTQIEKLSHIWLGWLGIDRAFLVAQLEPGRTANPLGILPPMARILFVYGWFGIPKEKGFFDSQKPQNIPGIICGFRPGVVVI